MAVLQQYKCPNCGGAVEFNAGAQKMKCPYCDTEFEMESLAGYDKESAEAAKDDLNWNTDDISEWTEDEATGLRSYICKSCGGEIIGDENMAATSCPYCDNPIVVTGTVAGALKPDYIIPFKLDKKAAKEKFNEHLAGKKLLPKAFKEQNHIDEIKGVYVPYWLFDSKATASMRYKATRNRLWTSGEKDYHETSYYGIVREGELSFEHIPHDGSTKMPDDLMESIEPFDFSQAVPFQQAYFAGYMADKYDVDEKQSAERIGERVKKATENSFLHTVHGFDSVIPDGGSVQLINGKTSYAMYPVWILTTKWKDETYLFAMNGQTGKFVGNLPEDKSVMKRILFTTAGISAAIIYAIMALVYFL